MERFKEKCDEVKVKIKPKNVECAKELYPDVWTSPEIVCEVKADEITLSPLHTAGETKENHGLALRFPRFVGYRPDKSSEETTSVEELKELYDLQYTKKSKEKNKKKST